MNAEWSTDLRVRVVHDRMMGLERNSRMLAETGEWCCSKGRSRTCL